MSKIKITQDGKRSVRYLNNIKEDTQDAIRQSFYHAGKAMLADSRKEILTGLKTGNVYRVKINGVTKLHRASAPGEAPANLTGNLRKSLGFEVSGWQQLEFGSRDGPPAAGVSPKQNVAEYSKFLELGTSTMKPRPYLKPAIDKNERSITVGIETELRKKQNG